jgi:hypothetical protein
LVSRFWGTEPIFIRANDFENLILPDSFSPEAFQQDLRARLATMESQRANDVKAAEIPLPL